ncbi:MAG: hypothetical protein ABWZ03_08140, partial [Solirubrobacterales bacterium]
SEPLAESLDPRNYKPDANAALDPIVIPQERVAPIGDPARHIFNVNTPEDVERAEHLLAGGGRFSRGLMTGDPAPPKRVA